MTRFALTAALSLLATGACVICSGAIAAEGETGTLSLTIENDAVGGTDRHYTNGLRVAYVSAPKTPGALERWFVGEGDTFRRSFAAGQSIYTPEDIFSAVPDEGDHPYAGHLFAEYALLKENDGRFDLVTFELGVVGPSALAEETQNWFHRTFGFYEAQGWDTQIDDELAVGFSYDWKGRPLAAGDAGSLQWEVTPAAGASLGTTAINARAGGMLRIGDNLEPNFGPARIRPSLTGSGHFDRANPFDWYAFVGVQGRAVGHDIFIDGSLFDEDSPSTTKNQFVADLQAGAAITWGRAQLSWTYVHRTERYESQTGADGFGALTLSVKM